MLQQKKPTRLPIPLQINGMIRKIKIIVKSKRMTVKKIVNTCFMLAKKNRVGRKNQKTYNAKSSMKKRNKLLPATLIARGPTWH